MPSRRENGNAPSLRPPGWTNNNGTSGRLYTLSNSASSSSLVNLATAPRSDPNLSTSTSNPNEATIHPFNNPSSSSNPFTASSGMMLTAPDNMRRKEKKEAKEKRERNRQKKSNAARLAANALAGDSGGTASEIENQLIGSSTLRPPSSNGSASGGVRSPAQRPTTPSHSDSNRAASPANPPPTKKKRQRTTAAINSSGIASGSAQASSSRVTRTSQDRERSSSRNQIQSSQPHPRPASAQAGPIASSSNATSSESRRGLTRSSSGGASSSAAGSRTRSITNPNPTSTPRRPSASNQEEDSIAQEILTDAPSAPAYIPDSRRSSAPNPSNLNTDISTNPSSNDPNSNLSPNGSLSSRRGQSINIYSQLSTLGLPGAEEDSEDPDDLPPPFPEGATRPHSPPRPPQPGPDGEIVWTEEDRRRQEEAEQYRVPDSPPPAFRSDEEGESGAASEGVNRRREERRRRNEIIRREQEERERGGNDRREESEASDLSSDGENEVLDEAVRLEREAWQADIDAGLSLEERISRERERREGRESNQRQEVMGMNDDAQDANNADPQRLSVPLSPPNALAPVSPATAAHAAAQALADELELDNQAPTSTSTLPPLNLDQSPIPTQINVEEPTPIQTSTPSALHNETRLAPPPKSAIKHRRISSDSRAQQLVESSRAAAASSSSRPTSSSGMESKRGKATRIRARPASESHSRFRDDATAASERRRALWGSSAAQSDGIGLSVPLAPLLRASQEEHAEVVVDAEDSPNLVAPVVVGRTTESTPSAEEESDAESSSSEDAWRAEEEAFRAMQKREADAAAAAASAAIASDSDEEEAPLPIPRRDPSTSVSVPRAPPPLVLGRSRGGAAYSSSSASSSDDEDRRNMESSSEDEFEEGGSASLHSVPSAISLHSLGETSKDTLEGSSMPGAFSLARASSSRQLPDPERIRAPRAFVPSEGEDQMIAQGVASLFSKPDTEMDSQEIDSSTIKGKGKDKGKAPDRGASFYDAQVGLYVPITLRMESPPNRAGHFQEDSGSSKDFGSEDEETADQTINHSKPQISNLSSKPQPTPPSHSHSQSQPVAVPSSSRLHNSKSREFLVEANLGRRSSESEGHRLPSGSPPRAAVSSRLKGLFGTPLVSPPAQSSPSSNPKSPVLEQGHVSSSRRSPLRRSSSGREEAQKENAESSAATITASSSLNRKPSSSSTRSNLRRKDSSGSSGFEAPEPSSSTARMTSEEKARKDALAQIASLHTPGQPRQDSLAALERMLSIGSRPTPVQDPSRRETEDMDRILLPQPGEQGSSRLSRQGAVVNRRPPQVPPITYPRGSGARPSSFINPRSAAAPLPRQSRLPAITDATRHFPPSRNSSVVGAPPPWLSQMHQGENGRLPRPISPTRSSNQMPPSLPLRPAGSRVSAMISKFEAPTDEESEYHSGRESPSRRSLRNETAFGSRPGSSQVDPVDRLALQAQFASQNGRGSIDDSREDVMRRRPPPVQPIREQGNPSTNPFRNSSASSRPTSLQNNSHPVHLQPPSTSASSSNHQIPPEPSPRTQAFNSLTGNNWSSADAYARRTPSPIPPPTESFNASLAAAQAATIGRRRGGERPDPPPVPFRPQHLEHRRENSGDGFQRRDEVQGHQAFSMPPRPPRFNNQAPDLGSQHSTGATGATADLLGIAELLPTSQERSSSPQSNPSFRRPLPRPPTMLSSTAIGSSSSSHQTDRPSTSTMAALGLGSAPIPERPTPQRSPSSSSIPSSNIQRSSGAVETTTASNGMGDVARRPPTREPSLGITDLDLMVSQLEREGAHYEELAAIGEFLGPARETKARPDEVAALPVGRVEVEKRRVNKDGRVKQKLAVVGVRVDKCAICMAQFKVDQMAALFPCQHIFHEKCATRLLQLVRSCPVCRADISTGEIA